MNRAVVHLVICLIIILASCTTPPGNKEIYEGMDAETAIKMKQYYVEGKRLYQLHCQNCHNEQGSGLGQVIPPLANSDYLLAQGASVGCFIRFGQKGPITVNGITYNQPMPANKALTDLQIAELITYISNSWGNKKGLIDVNTTQKALADCKD